MAESRGVFCDLQPPLDPTRARIEASRCYYCYDAPCIQACPTQIDIPSFIRKIGNDNVRGAALDILGANIMGGTCARACPVETLCQEACVREASEAKPVQIGQLQRYATDAFFASGEQPFKREASNGKRVAIVGAGPSGLSCAHRLAQKGYEVTIFEACEKSGGLNEYGLAPYKMMDDFAQREVKFILDLGGITIKHGQRLGRDLELGTLRKQYDAVFLGIGLGDVNRLGVPGEELTGVMDAVKQIAEIRQAKELKKIAVARHVVVIGGGNTAVDIAIQMKQLGAEYVTLVYRRGREHMGATEHEQELAQTNGVLLKTWAKPVRILATDVAKGSGSVGEVEFEYTEATPDGKVRGTGRTFRIAAEQVFKAIGQTMSAELGEVPAIVGGKFKVNAEFETEVPGVFAGGDGVGPGEDLTVTAIQQGKLAADAIHKKLSASARPTPSGKLPREKPMADLTANIAGIKSPNPFWLASAPPTDKKINVERAFKAGWGGAVWKTLGEDPPVVNVCSRYGAVELNGQKMMGFNNIELITDRPLELNLREIKEVKRAWPDRAVVVSLMVPCDEESWKKILKRVEDTAADAIELNFGCPHGMSERGMGSAVGQVPDYVEMVTRWCKTHSRMPVLVKLTPNITDVRAPARAAKKGGADGVSLINTINSITNVDLDLMAPKPTVGGKGTHGGYCGPAVKPIALNMVAEIARDPATRGIPISGIGGISDWRDAAEFMSLGSSTVQVCTAAMHYGFKIVSDMTDGLSNWMDAKGYRRLEDFIGKAVPNVVNWNQLDLNYKTIAEIDQSRCIQCGLCYIACEDTSHQAISAARVNGVAKYEVIEPECVGCNLCSLACPVDCIAMVERPSGKPYLPWTKHPNNPMRAAD